MPGIFVVNTQLPIGPMIEEVLLIAEASETGE